MRKAFVFALVLIAALIASAAAPAVHAASKVKIWDVNITIKVEKLGVKVKSLSTGKSAKAAIIEYTWEANMKGFEGDSFDVPIAVPFITPSKYKGAQNPVLLEYRCTVGEEVVAEFKNETGVKLGKLGDMWVVTIKFNREIKADETVHIKVTVKGMIKMTYKLYATKEYKYPKDYSKVKTIYIDILNLMPYKWNKNVTVTIISPKGYHIMYIKTSIIAKTRGMDVRDVEHYWDYSVAKLVYISTSTMAPTSLSPGKYYSVEVGFIKAEHVQDPPVLAWTIFVLLLAAASAYLYRDVYKYVKRAVA